MKSPAVKSILEQAKAQAVAEGRAEGQRELLLRQLEIRFGKLSPSAVARVEGAPIEALTRWSERILNAQTLDEVWG